MRMASFSFKSLDPSDFDEISKWHKDSELGDRPPNSYYLFSITVELGKRVEVTDYGSFRKGCEKVYVRELGSLKQPRKSSSALIKT